MHGSWRAAFALFAYAATFSFAYITLSAGVGALLLFGAVQATMVTTGIVRGERLTAPQWFGFIIALLGLAVLLIFPVPQRRRSAARRSCSLRASRGASIRSSVVARSIRSPPPPEIF